MLKREKYQRHGNKKHFVPSEKYDYFEVCCVQKLPCNLPDVYNHSQYFSTVLSRILSTLAF